MGSVRINIGLPKDLDKDLSREIEARKSSQFIAGAISGTPGERRHQRLAAEYNEAGMEIYSVNCDLEGSIADRLD